ncbi:phage tail tip protein [Escherichia coli]|uniref:phage tail tip domain-containing protein n=1 Tax=Escherichia coli TaxID=562 RepID=UPI003855A41F
MPQRNDRSRSTPTTSPKNNSWFRMQAGHQSDADIYIYDEIGFWGVTAKQFISDLNALGDITHINLHINSPGGDVFEGIAIFNALKTHGASITVYVDGVAASMASIIAMVGNQIEGDLVKTVGKAFPRDSRAPERWPSGTITVRVYDDQPFDRQIVIPAVAFSGAKHERDNNDIYSSCRLIVRKNGAEIYNRTALDNTLIYSGVIDMPAGRGHMTLEFSVSSWLVNDWYPTASISDLLVVVMKKATAGISIS